ncbi:hypothetical protein ACFSQJ_17085 [Croceitalea marina]|uniref:Uncharacterized protein n=1 Tax=Croceitalea marina TaxID=1775166 RepID=A0ABW5N1J7_9FLAO
MKDDLQTWKHAFKVLSHILIPASAMIFVQDPVLASGTSNFFLQTLYGIQSDIKQKRVFSMLEGIEALLQKNNPDFVFEKTNIQETRDLLETAIINASRANTDEKINLLRKIMYGQIVNPQPYDYTSRYLDLAVRLNENQIKILLTYVETEKDLKPIRIDLSKMSRELSEAERVEKEIFSTNSKSSNNQRKIFKYKKDEAIKKMENKKLEYYKLTNVRSRMIKSFEKDVFQFLFNELRVLGLVYNPSEGKSSDAGDQSFYTCTALAFGFINFLREYDMKSN